MTQVDPGSGESPAGTLSAEQQQRGELGLRPAGELSGIEVKFPWVSASFVVLMFGLYVALRNWAGSSEGRIAYFLLASGAKVNALIEDGQWWRLVSASLLHGYAGQLSANALGIVLLGALVESLAGRLVMLAVLVASGVASTAAAVFLSPTPLVGASGVLYGVLGAHLMAMALVWKRVHRATRWMAVTLPGIVGMAAMVAAMVEGRIDVWSQGVSLGVGALFVLMALLFRKLGLGGSSLAGLRAVAWVVVVSALLIPSGHVLHRLWGGHEPVNPRLEVESRLQTGPYWVPDGWSPGVFIDDGCQLGEAPVEHDIRCFADPYHTVYLVGEEVDLMASSVAREWVARRSGRESEWFLEDRIMMSSDPQRGLGFAMLVFEPFAVRYETLFAALSVPVYWPGRSFEDIDVARENIGDIPISR